MFRLLQVWVVGHSGNECSPESRFNAHYIGKIDGRSKEVVRTIKEVEFIEGVWVEIR